MENKEKQVAELANSVGDFRVVKLKDLIPYWRNPWDNNASAVNAVANSIEELTFFNPIIVDKDMTIICGHTRYKALKQLGVENVVVMVSNLDELTAKQYRIADNKTTELSNWLIDRVREEYEKLPNSKTVDLLFPTIAMANPEASPEKPEANPFVRTPEDIDYDEVVIELICPHCFNAIEDKLGNIKRLIAKGEQDGKA